MACEMCTSPKTSKDGDTECNYGEKGYHRDGDDCKISPEGAECDGGTTLESMQVKEGYSRLRNEFDDVRECTE